MKLFLMDKTFRWSNPFFIELAKNPDLTNEVYSKYPFLKDSLFINGDVNLNKNKFSCLGFIGNLKNINIITEFLENSLVENSLITGNEGIYLIQIPKEEKEKIDPKIKKMIENSYSNFIKNSKIINSYILSNFHIEKSYFDNCYFEFEEKQAISFDNSKIYNSIIKENIRFYESKANSLYIERYSKVVNSKIYNTYFKLGILYSENSILNNCIINLLGKEQGSIFVNSIFLNYEDLKDKVSYGNLKVYKKLEFKGIK